MKKLLVMAALAALVATSASATVISTKHDLSSTGPTAFNTNSTEVCVFCHTPHGAATGANYLPLWNRNGSTNPTGFYTSDSIQHTVTEVATQATDAYLCLSCHDGVQFIETLNNPPNTPALVNNSTAIAGTANLGLVMSNDHPIGFVYGGTAVDDELKAKPATLPFFGANQDEMWCSTCHDVHGGAAGTPFLQIANGQSALCIACHTK